MAEVIDLLSSSPPPTVNDDQHLQNAAISISRRQPHNDDYSNIFDEPDFPIVPPTKRRRISPPPNQTRSRTRLGSGGTAKTRAAIEKTVSKPSKDAFEQFPFEEDDFELENITFSSSAPNAKTQSFTDMPEVVSILSDDDDAGFLNDDPILSSSQPVTRKELPLSDRTSNLLANMSARALKSKTKPTLLHTSSSRTGFKSSAKESLAVKQRSQAATDFDDILDSSQVRRTGSQSMPSNSQKGRDTDGSRTTTQDKKKSSKAVDAAAEKLRKQAEKEKKKAEKQKAADIAEVNKSKTNKKVSTPEMIVEMSKTLKSTSIGNQVEEFMKQLEVETRYFEETVDLSDESVREIGSIVRWQRRVTAEFNEDQEMWRPLDAPQVSKEKHIIIVITAEELFTIAVGSQLQGPTHEHLLKFQMDNYIRSMRRKYSGHTLILLIQGFTTWLNRNKNAKNRSYTAAVRAQALDDEDEVLLEVESQTQNSRKRKARATSSKDKPDFSQITTDIAESILLHLQLCHQPLQIHHTTSVHTTAQQISQFTQHLSTRPYRLVAQTQNLARAGFCMETGQIRTAADAKETYLAMLQEINRVTPSMAIGISQAGFDSIRKLVEGFQSEGNLLLEDVKKALNKDGGWSDRRLGPMVSKRLYKVFMGTDPASRDGIA